MNNIRRGLGGLGFKYLIISHTCEIVSFTEFDIPSSWPGKIKIKTLIKMYYVF